MKIVSWNVNGLRASIKHSTKSLKAFLDGLGAEIICFQETKAKRDQLDETTYSAEGYNAYFSFCKTRAGYSGVVTFCRDCVTPVLAEEGLTGILSTDRQDSIKCYGHTKDFTEEELTSLDAEGRSVMTEHLMSNGERLVIVNVYCPMVTSENPLEKDSENQARMDYKIKFYSVLKKRCSTLEKAGKHVLVVGDLNFSREINDSAFLQEDPSLLEESHPPREFMRHFITSSPTTPSLENYLLLDTFRYVHPTDDKAFTCWSTMLDCRKTNYGTRIDYILCSMSLSSSLSKADVWQHVYGSDHCPVFAEFKLTLTPSSTQPSLSAAFFSSGKQKKLSDFFTLGSSSATSINDDTLPPPAKKQKRSQKAAAAKPPVKQSLLSFMKPISEQKPKQDAEQSDSQFSTTEEKPPPSKGGTDLLLHEALPVPQKVTSGLSGAWQSILTGPPKPPLCEGHQEPCVLRTVKKQGPNLNRQFWVCARPHGSKNDPASRCDYFKWIKKK